MNAFDAPGLHECQAVTRCTLPAMAPSTNGDLDAALHVANAAWATCAASRPSSAEGITSASSGAGTMDTVRVGDSDIGKVRLNGKRMSVQYFQHYRRNVKIMA